MPLRVVPWPRWGALLLVLVISALAAAGSARSLPAHAGGKGLPEVTIVIGDDGVTAPAVVPAGLVALTFDNRGAASYSGVLAHLHDGVPPAVLETTFAPEDYAEFARLVAATLGGPAFLAPGAQHRLVVDLAAGTHVLASFGEDGPPAVTVLRAQPPAVAHEPPAVVGEVIMGDFFFRAPAFVTGASTVRLINEGRQIHHMLIYRLTPGVTLEQVLGPEAEDIDPVAAGLVTPATGVMALTPGASAYPTLAFTPGNYAMVCFIEDPATDLPHVALGMALPFTVR